MKATLTLALAMLFSGAQLGAPSLVHAQSQSSYESYSAKTSLWWPRLRYKDHSPEIKALQRLLALHGMKVRPDGVFGTATLGAVRNFQKQKGLKVDGIVGSQTWERLVPSVGHGSRGQAVVVLQTLLNEYGNHLRVDGAYGPATQKAANRVEEEIIIPFVGGRVSPSVWCYLVGGHIDGE